MNNFQIALIIIGLLAIGLVLLYNWWQNNNAEKKQRRRFGESTKDPLMNNEPEEPFTYTTDNGSGKAINPVPDSQATTNFIPEPEDIDKTFGTHVADSPLAIHPEHDAPAPQAEEGTDAPIIAAKPDPSNVKDTQDPAAAEADTAVTEGSADDDAANAATKTPAAAKPESSAAPDLSDENSENEPDPQTEVVIDLPFQAPLSGQQIQTEVLKYPEAVDKPIRYFVVTNDGSSHLAIRPNEQYVAIQMAVQLANRNGPITAVEWARAGMIADELATQFDANIEIPELKRFEARAQKLDEVCALLDAQVSISVVPRNPQSVDHVVALARRNSFVDYRQTLAWCNPQGIACFYLLFDSVILEQHESTEVERITFLIDVPNSPPNPHAFGKMVAAAQDMAKSLDAIIVDDQGQVLQGPETLDQVDAQLVDLYNELEKAGLPAGSERNARVFS